MPLKEYEEEILFRMFDEEIIHNKYLQTQTITNRLNWTEIQTRYHINKKFKSIMDKLHIKGYISDHGKSGNVYSLTFEGVAYVRRRSNDKICGIKLLFLINSYFIILNKIIEFLFYFLLPSGTSK